MTPSADECNAHVRALRAWIQAYRPGDDFFHYFRGAGIDARHASGGVTTADLVLHHKTVATVKLYTFIGRASLHFAGPEFCLGGTFCRQLTLVVLFDTAINERIANVQLGPNFGQLEPRILKIRDWLAKYFALLDVFDCRIECRMRVSKISTCQDQALFRPPVHPVREPPVPFADRYLL